MERPTTQVIFAGAALGATITMAVLAILCWRARRADYRRQMLRRLDQLSL